MTDIDDDWDDTWDGENYRDRDDYPEPDGDDYELGRQYAEYAEHCEQKHGGGECHCKPSLRARLHWKLADARRWIDVRLHPDRYDKEPPF